MKVANIPLEQMDELINAKLIDAKVSYRKSRWNDLPSVMYDIAEIYRKNKMDGKALSYYIASIYFSTSGLVSSYSDETRIEKIEDVFINPQIEHKMKIGSNDQIKAILRQCYKEAYLPFHYFNRETLYEIIINGDFRSLENYPTKDIPKHMVKNDTIFDDEDESQYDLPYDQWYNQEVLPLLDEKVEDKVVVRNTSLNKNKNKHQLNPILKVIIVFFDIVLWTGIFLSISSLLHTISSSDPEYGWILFIVFLFSIWYLLHKELKK